MHDDSESQRSESGEAVNGLGITATVILDTHEALSTHFKSRHTLERAVQIWDFLEIRCTNLKHKPRRRALDPTTGFDTSALTAFPS